MIQKPCPSCKTPQSIFFNQNKLSCKNQNCDFEIYFSCPICNTEVDPSSLNQDTQGEFFICQHCKQQIHLKRLSYLIDNGMQVDLNHRCGICNSPTVHRKDMNIGNRCFFFPKCSGQSQLFGNTHDSLVFLDFETTGLDAGLEHIIEIGAVKIDEEGYEHTFLSFVKPPKPLDTKISSITGITNEMLESASPIEQVLPLFLEFIGSAILVAHNAEFDITWLLVNAKRLNLQLQSTQVICTVQWAKQSGEAQASLGSLTKKYKIMHQHMHRALADAAATKELFFVFDQHKKSARPLVLLKSFEALSNQLISRKAIA